VGELRTLRLDDSMIDSSSQSHVSRKGETMLEYLQRWLDSLMVRDSAKSDPESYFRQSVVGAATIAQGLTAGNVDSLPIFERMLGVPPKGSRWDLGRPFRIINNPDGTLNRTEGISTCGLGARGISFQAGVLWPEFSRPYDYLKEPVFGVMQSHAKRAGALHKNMPKPGDHFIIGSGYGTHMGTCVSVSGGLIVSVDAGQVDDKPGRGRRALLQRFKRIERNWGNLSVVCVLDTWKLFQHFLADR
jgi:hypothetical protein